MKKLPLVLALGAASLCSVASAQNVTVYGRFYPYISSEKASDATPVSNGTVGMSTLAAAAAGASPLSGGVRGMAAGNSNLGVKGQESLWGNLKGIYQMEGVVSVDNGSSAGHKWDRNGFVGLTGDFGTVRLGYMDTVFKEYGDTIGVLNVSSGTPMSSSNILRKPSFGTNNAARFHERRANTVRYDSPSFSGFEAGLQVATEENPNTTTGVGAAKTYSLGLKYDNGPIYVALAHEIHDNWFGGSINAPTAMRNNAQVGITSKDSATQLTVEWRISKEHKIEFDAIQKRYKENANVAGRFESYQNNAYLLGMENRWGDQWRTVAQIVRSDKGTCTRFAAACTTDGLEGSKFIAGASYYLSRRTYLFGLVDKMTNGKAARFAANDFGAVNPGEDTQHLIVGISHGF